MLRSASHLSFGQTHYRGRCYHKHVELGCRGTALTCPGRQETVPVPRGHVSAVPLHHFLHHNCERLHATNTLTLFEHDAILCLVGALMHLPRWWAEANIPLFHLLPNILPRLPLSPPSGSARPTLVSASAFFLGDSSICSTPSLEGVACKAGSI